MSLKISRFETNYNLSFFSYYSVTLNWSPPINRGGVELTGYVIEKRLSTTHKWEKAATVDASVTLYTIENLKEKSEYYFRVSAENEEGAGEPAATEKVALRTSARKYYNHSGLKYAKKSQVWEVAHCLPQRLNTTVFEIFSSGAVKPVE